MAGLIDLQTDLKKLKYGAMPLGGEAPYVTKDITAPGNTNGVNQQVRARVDDLSRISKMFVSKPGLKYLANEAILQQEDFSKKINTAKQSGKTTVGAVIQQIGKTAINSAKLVGSTLAQVPVNGTGTHFIRGFRTDTYLQPTGGNLRSSFAQFFGAGGVEGAYLAQSGKPIVGEVASQLIQVRNGKEEPTTGPENLTYNRPLSPQYVDDRENLKRSTSSIEENTPKLSAQNGNPVKIGTTGETTLSAGSLSGSLDNRDVTGNYSQEAINIPVPTRISGSLDNREVTGSYSQEVANKKVTDFRKNSTTSYSFDYSAKTVKKELRVNLGDQGAAIKSTKNYTITDSTGIDKINNLDIRSSKAGDGNRDGIQDGRDFIKFYFEIITPDGSTFLYFRAFLDKLGDSYNATWDGRRYVGRAENFYTYGGFDRNLNFSFKIAAATRAEMKPLYRKMAFLASSTAPTYQQNGGFMRGTLAKITIGSYIVETPGIIESVDFNWDKEYPWEIAMQNPENGIDDDMQELPTVLDCAIKFKPIHNFAPQTGLYHYITNPSPEGKAKPFF